MGGKRQRKQPHKWAHAPLFTRGRMSGADKAAGHIPLQRQKERDASCTRPHNAADPQDESPAAPGSQKTSWGHLRGPCRTHTVHRLPNPAQAARCSFSAQTGPSAARPRSAYSPLEAGSAPDPDRPALSCPGGRAVLQRNQLRSRSRKERTLKLSTSRGKRKRERGEKNADPDYGNSYLASTRP